jgi:hypothetical protein
MLTPFEFYFLLIIGCILFFFNLCTARNAGQPREEKDKNYPKGHYYILDAFVGLVIILIALGVL